MTIPKKVVIIGCTAFIIAAGAVAGAVAYNNNVKDLTIVECASVDSIPSNSDDTKVYKVGSDYYTYFSSTGAVELVDTATRSLDTDSFEVIKALYTNNIEGSQDELSVSDRLENISVFNNVLTARLEYLYKELDNCEANLLIDPTNQDWLDYKTQLENEITSILTYRTAVSSVLTTILESVDANSSLTESLSSVLDNTLTDSVKDYNNAQTHDNDVVTAESYEAMQAALTAQQALLDSLEGKYDDLNDLLVAKRVNLDEVVDAVKDSDEFASLIDYLDQSVDSYVADCTDQYNSLSLKIAALEKLNETLSESDDDTNDTSEDVQALLAEYDSLKEQQTSLKDKIAQLEALLENQNSEDASGVSDLLESQLKDQQTQLDAITSVLDGTSIDTIENLTENQQELLEYIQRLEDAYAAADNLLTTDQVTELKNLKTELETLIFDLKNSDDEDNTVTLDDETISKIVSQFTPSVVYMGSGTQEALNELTALIESNEAADAERDEYITYITNLLTSLDDDINYNDEKLAEIKSTLVDLVTSTAVDMQAEILSQLNDDITAQETKLAETKAALETLVNATSQENAEAQEALQAELDKLDSNTQEAIGNILKMLADDDLTSDTIVVALNNLDSSTKASIAALAATVGNNTTSISSLSDDVDTLSADTTSALQTLRTTVNNNNTSTTSSISTLSNSLTSYASSTDQAIASLRQAISANDASQTAALTAAVATLQADIDDSDSDVSDLSAALEALKERITTLETESGVQSAQDTALAAQVAAISAQYDSIISQCESKIATEKANLVVAYTNADSALESKLSEKIATEDAALKARIDAADANIATLFTDYTSANSDIYKLTTDLASLTSTYTAYVASTNQSISDLTAALAAGDNGSNGYTDAAVATLNTTLTNLKTDYDTYKVSTNTELNRLATLISAIDGTTMSSDISDLKVSLATLKSSTESSLAIADAKVDSAVAQLKTTLADNYATVTTSVGNLDKRITALESLTTTHTTDISTLKTNLSTLTDTVTSLSKTVSGLSTTVSNLSDAIDDLGSSDDSDSSASTTEYTLPIASTTTLGGIKVDNDILYITSDGTLRIDTSALSASGGSLSGGTTVTGETIAVGTVWSNYSDIPAAYRDYCIQANFVSLDSEPEMLWKEEEEEWYLYSIKESSSSSGSASYSSPTYTVVTTSWTAWYVTATRPNKYATIEKIPVTVYYYGFDDGTGGEVWTRYAVKHNITKTEKITTKTETHTTTWTSYTGSVLGSDGAYHSYTGYSQTGDTVTSTTYTYANKTFLNIWDDSTAYDKYGPESDYVVSSYKGCYLSGCDMTQSQRTKLWDSGALKAFCPIYYDSAVFSGMNSAGAYAADYAIVRHNMIFGIATNGATSSPTEYDNTATLNAMPENLSTAAVTSASAYPYSAYNFTECGLAYKLAYLYGNHCWIYVGTP